MYSANVIAKYTINWCNENSVQITNLKLQKLLYFIQGEFIRQYRERLIKEDFYAWQLGPVIPEIYSDYSIYSSSELPMQKLDFQIAEKDEMLINASLSKYARYSAWDLVEISHSQDPWKYNFEIFGDKALIPFKSIEDYFGRKN